ncbi:MAG: ATP-dependent Clp protease proteolytic subunit [Lachnospiraceae bacterium]|nr:ATP-dependent Clp protease proteolytic subunit [Lachnospiraceae bacterium]
MNFIPTVKLNDSEIYSDIFSTLLEQRNVMVQGPITSELAMTVNSQLLYLASKSNEPIEMYIDSPGGSVSAGLSIIDIMNHIKPDVITICCGNAASMGAVIFSAGAQGKRYMLPHSECMIHQPSTGFEGKESDIRIVADNISRKKQILIDILSKNCHQDREKVEKDIEYDKYMTASECVEYGIADKILDE